MKENRDWFRLKRYPHIGLPLEPTDRAWIEKYISNPNQISKHAFYPFIHRKLSVRKYRREKDVNGNKSIFRTPSYKEREVFYASHLDSLIYSYYSSLLNEKYERELRAKGLEESITAYRKIKLYESSHRNKCNVDFANDIFNYIQRDKQRKLAVVTFDITSFFDNLDHFQLKKAWCRLLETEQLPEDHYKVFRNLTKFSYVELEDIYNEFKNEILTGKGDEQKRVFVPRIDLLKQKEAVAFCDKTQFEKRIREKGLIKTNKYDSLDYTKLRRKGIPQGSPISAILANIYMLDFDFAINESVKKLNGIYRRYSDDMIVIVEEEFLETIVDVFKLEIEKTRLEIQEKKTQIFLFKNYDSIFKGQEFNPVTGLLNSNSKFEYLGFSFNGEYVYLKNSALAKYYRKLKRNVRRGGFFAKYGKNQVPKLFKGRLYKGFSHLGSERRTIYKPDAKDPNKWIKTNKYDWGNFLSYANLASRVFPKNKIKSQTKKHWNLLHKLMLEKQIEIDAHYNSKKS